MQMVRGEVGELRAKEELGASLVGTRNIPSWKGLTGIIQPGPARAAPNPSLGIPVASKGPWSCGSPGLGPFPGEPVPG